MAGPVAVFDSSSYYKVRSLYITRPPIPSLAWMLSAMLWSKWSSARSHPGATWRRLPWVSPRHRSGDAGVVVELIPRLGKHLKMFFLKNISKIGGPPPWPKLDIKMCFPKSLGFSYFHTLSSSQVHICSSLQVHVAIGSDCQTVAAAPVKFLEILSYPTNKVLD